MRAHLAIATVLLLFGCSSDEAPPEPEPAPEPIAPETLLPAGCGHAHNDYEHPEPLTRAVELGFCSIEVDVILVDDQLLVAHTLSEVDPSRTLQSLYLEPLTDLHQAGELDPVGGETTILLIDVKSAADATYAAIDEALVEYADLFTRFEEGEVYRGPVTALISGNRDRETMEGQALRYAALDGRPGDFGTDVPLHLMPLVSQAWYSSFDWDGTGDMPAAERSELETIVETAHDEGRRMRFWASPDLEVVWETLLAVEADLVNTDDLDGFAAYQASQ